MYEKLIKCAAKIMLCILKREQNGFRNSKLYFTYTWKTEYCQKI